MHRTHDWNVGILTPAVVLGLTARQGTTLTGAAAAATRTRLPLVERSDRG